MTAIIVVAITSGCAVNNKKSTAIVPELEGIEIVPINTLKSLKEIKEPKRKQSVIVN